MGGVGIVSSVFSCLFCKAVTAIKVKMIISIRVTLSISHFFSPKTILKMAFFCVFRISYLVWF